MRSATRSVPGERIAGAGQPAALRWQRAGGRWQPGLARIEPGAVDAGAVRAAGEPVTDVAGWLAVAAMAGGAVGQRGAGEGASGQDARNPARMQKIQDAEDQDAPAPRLRA